MAKFVEVDKREIHILENALGQFFEDVLMKGRRQAIDAGGYWINQVDGENLLKLRKDLVNSIKRGMLNRKDIEIDIALKAFMVWYHRTELDRARRMKLEDIAIQEENEGDRAEQEAWDAVRKAGQT